MHEKGKKTKKKKTTPGLGQLLRPTDNRVLLHTHTRERARTHAHPVRELAFFQTTEKKRNEMLALKNISKQNNEYRVAPGVFLFSRRR